jgi:uracil phosphoribosyltransferase
VIPVPPQAISPNDFGSLPMALQLRVYVPPHPLIQHWLGVARDKETQTPLFRSALSELGKWLTYEAIREWLPTVEMPVETPLTTCPGRFIDPQTPIAIVPVLRAGLAFVDAAQQILPLSSVYHIGVVRNEETLEPSVYLNKFPKQFDPNARILITEPMLATGGSLTTVLAELLQRGIDIANIRVISVVAAPQALQKLNTECPGLVIYAATIDEGLNDQGFIVPGLGDAGDRTFGTN